MTIGQRIKSLRETRDMTRSDFSKYIGVSTVSITNWENDVKSPSMKNIIDICRVFQVRADDLLSINYGDPGRHPILPKDEYSLLETYRFLDSYGKQAVRSVCDIEKTRLENQNRMIHITEGTRYLPRFTNPAAAGSPSPLDGEDFEMILVTEDTPKGADFCVRIQGDSMEPHIHDGDLVYVKKTKDLKNCDVAIFCVDGESYCKQYYKDDAGNLTLVSTNPLRRDKNVRISSDSNSSVEVLGKVLLKKHIGLPTYLFE